MKRLIALSVGALVLSSLVVGQVSNNPTFTKQEAGAAPAAEPSPEGRHEMTAVDI